MKIKKIVVDKDGTITMYDVEFSLTPKKFAEPMQAKQPVTKKKTRKHKKYKWSDKDIATLKKLLQQGYSRKAIAIKMGRTYNSVKGAINYHLKTTDISEPKKIRYDIETIHKVFDMLDKGYKYKDIAETLGTSQKAIYNLVYNVRKKKIKRLNN